MGSPDGEDEKARRQPNACKCKAAPPGASAVFFGFIAVLVIDTKRRKTLAKA